MKKIMSFLFASMILAFVSCEKSEDSTSGELEYLFSTPDVVESYLSENYPDAGVSAILKFTGDENGYLVVLNTSEMLVFDLEGTYTGDSLTPGFCDSTFGHRWGHRGRPHGGGHHGGGHHGGHPAGGIPADSLPETILAWITSNYPEGTPRHAHLDTLCNLGAVTAVMVSSDSQPPVKLIFGTENQYLGLASRTRFSDLPEIVRSAVASLYSEYLPRRKAETYTLDDGTTEYRIFLHKSGIRMKVVIKGDGSVHCEES